MAVEAVPRLDLVTQLQSRCQVITRKIGKLRGFGKFGLIVRLVEFVRAGAEQVEFRRDPFLQPGEGRRIIG